jgi:hypothetical protein
MIGIWAISRAMGPYHIYRFGEDVAGELYIVALLDQHKGVLYKLVH